MINEEDLQDLVVKHIKIDKGDIMSSYIYELNTLYKNDSYDELLEIYNNANEMLNEGVLSIPKNKIKEMIKKISSIKNDKQMKSFVNKNKKFIKPEKELKQKVINLARQLNFTDGEIQIANNSIVKALAAISQFSTLVTILGIPLLIVIMLNARVKKISLNKVTDRVIKDVTNSIKDQKHGPYSTSINMTIYGVLFFMGSSLVNLISLLLGTTTAGLLAFSLAGGALITALVLLIVSSVTFMWVFLGTPGRISRGE